MGPWNVLYFIPIIFFGSFYLVNLMLAVVSLAYEIESENAIKVNVYLHNVTNLIIFFLNKRLEAPPVKKNTIVYDIKTLKEKIDEKSKEIDERKKNAKKVEQNNTKQKTELVGSKEKTLFEDKSVYTGVLQTIGDDCILSHNNKTSSVSIKLSPDMGNFNHMVQEGFSSSRKR